MGLNLAELFTQLAGLPDEEVAALHPAHTADSVRALLPRLHHYTDGTCIVHHIFGGETCQVVQQVGCQHHALSVLAYRSWSVRAESSLCSWPSPST